MNQTPRLFSRFLADEQGATAIEYGLILGLMVIALVAALTGTGTETNQAFQKAADSYPPI
jgi:pilus assembly protein Flp/PilA